MIILKNKREEFKKINVKKIKQRIFSARKQLVKAKKN
jgi:hypothetical protein